jgi:hypothetical protein
VTVEAHRQALEERVTAFVSKLAHPDFDRSLRRWLVPVCPLVAGLSQVQGEFMLARLSEVARQAGVPLAGEKCSPNLDIVATADPSGLPKSWRRRDRPLRRRDAGGGAALPHSHSSGDGLGTTQPR